MHNVFPERRVGRKHPVIACQVGPGPRDQRGQARKEILRTEQDVGGAVAKGVLEFIADFPIDVGREPIQADGGPGDVAA